MKRKTRPTPKVGQCVALADEWESIGKRHIVTDAECNRAGRRLTAIEIKLAATPAKTMADIIAKARILKEWERQSIVTDDKRRFLARSLFADLERFAQPAATETTDPVVGLVADLYEAERSAEAATTIQGAEAQEDSESTEAAWERYFDLQRQIFTTPAATLAGLAARIRALAYLTTGKHDEGNEDFTLSVAADAERLMGGVS
jgi:hypothetical protein